MPLRKVLRNIAGFAYGGYLELHRIPSTWRMGLEAFEEQGSDREWQQLSMYCEVMNATLDVPGDIAEFGVASGASFKAFVRLNHLFNLSRHGDFSKKWVYGFDCFVGLPDLDQNIDLATPESRLTADMKKGGFDSQGTLPDLERFCQKYSHADLVKGYFSETIPYFISEHPHCSFSLIHIDCDIYSSSLEVMRLILPRLNVGGIVLFDEIFHRGFPGETSAFWEVYNSMESAAANLKLKFHRVESMPWKWFCMRER